MNAAVIRTFCSRSIPIRVKTLNGRASFYLELCADETVRSLTARVSRLDGRPEKDRRFTYCGLSLTNYRLSLLRENSRPREIVETSNRSSIAILKEDL